MGPGRRSLRRTPSARSRGEGAIRGALFASALVSVVTTLAIIGSLVVETVGFFGDVNWADFLFGTKWTPLLRGDQQSFGVLPLVWGTVFLSLIALAVAVPLGLLAAIYLSEYAPTRVRKIVKPVF